MTRTLLVGSALLAVLAALGVSQRLLEQTAAAQAKGAVQAPRFEVDPMWPKPLPNHWVIGNVIGVGVDPRDHVYIIHRGAGSLEAKEIYAAENPPASDCCLPAPPVLEFDADGTFVRAWGGPGKGYEWPESNHGITPDSKGNLFIGGNGGNDGHILKFTQDGKFVKQFGFAYASAGSNDMYVQAGTFLDRLYYWLNGSRGPRARVTSHVLLPAARRRKRPREEHLRTTGPDGVHRERQHGAPCVSAPSRSRPTSGAGSRSRAVGAIASSHRRDGVEFSLRGRTPVTAFRGCSRLAGQALRARALRCPLLSRATVHERASSRPYPPADIRGELLLHHAHVIRMGDLGEQVNSASGSVSRVEDERGTFTI
jgi:hypothetical protein